MYTNQELVQLRTLHQDNGVLVGVIQSHIDANNRYGQLDAHHRNVMNAIRDVVLRWLNAKTWDERPAIVERAFGEELRKALSPFGRF